MPAVSGDKQVRARLDKARKKAAADPAVKPLQEKADGAAPGEMKAAYEAYFKALYGKMRALEPDLADRIGKIEAAALRRVQTLAPDDSER
jgi:hypothetical protein